MIYISGVQDQDYWQELVSRTRITGAQDQDYWCWFVMFFGVIIPLAVINVSLTSFELQDLMSRQTINDVSLCNNLTM